jgi:ABC-type multidrug transport system ATPase subunit
MPPAIETEGLRKTYRRRKGRTVAVDGLDLTVPEGGVFGFVGPNGSGKTTTIRCLLGLVRPTGGRAAMLGVPVPNGLPEKISSIGAIVESPALFLTMSGRENLRLRAAIDGIGVRQVDEVLERVGLADRSRDAVKKYSLGMRQRLALAAVLLKDPALLILDEPANGLDPAGIRNVRTLLRSLGDEGRTVFLSSHVLAEVEHICDSVAILRRGRCVAQGKVAEVMASAARGTAMLVTLDDLDAGHRVLRRAALPVERQNGFLRVGVGADGAARITETLAAERLWVTELRSEERTLEDLFLELTDDAELTEEVAR